MIDTPSLPQYLSRDKSYLANRRAARSILKSSATEMLALIINRYRNSYRPQPPPGLRAASAAGPVPILVPAIVNLPSKRVPYGISIPSANVETNFQILGFSFQSDIPPAQQTRLSDGLAPPGRTIPMHRAARQSA